MHPGKLLILLGCILIAAGILIVYGGKIPFAGKLPGDLRIERDGFSFYFPLTTCTIASLIVSALLYFFRR